MKREAIGSPKKELPRLILEYKFTMVAWSIGWINTLKIFTKMGIITQSLASSFKHRFLKACRLNTTPQQELAEIFSKLTPKKQLEVINNMKMALHWFKKTGNVELKRSFKINPASRGERK